MTKPTTIALIVLVLYAGLSDAKDVLRLSDATTIIVAADESWESENEEQINFRGHVEIRTPQWSVMADQAIVYGNLEDVSLIVAEGAPVYFIYASNSDDDAGDVVEGKGRHLEYNREARSLSLSGDADLKSAGRTMRSSKIDYNLEEQQLNAGGPEGVAITVDPDTSSSP